MGWSGRVVSNLANLCGCFLTDADGAVRAVRRQFVRREQGASAARVGVPAELAAEGSIEHRRSLVRPVWEKPAADFVAQPTRPDL